MKRFSSFTNDLTEARRTTRPDVLLRSPRILQGLINYLKKNRSLPFTSTEVGLTKSGNTKEKTEVVDLPVSNANAVVKTLEDAYFVMWPVGRGAKGNMSIARKVLNSVSLVTPKGRKSLYDVDSKTLGNAKGGRKAIPMKGGQSSADNQTNQGFQCVMSACISNGIQPTLANIPKIKKFVALGTSVNVETVMRGADASWINSAEVTHAGVLKGVKGYVKNVKGYIWMEEDNPEAKRIKSFAEKAAKMGKELFFSPDRWSAADIWLKHPGFNLQSLYDAKSLAQYNENIAQAFRDGNLIGISLKKVGTGTPKVTHKNVPDQPIVLKEWPVSPKYGAKDPYIGGIQGDIYWESTSHSGARLSMISHGPIGSLDYNIALNEGSGGKRDGRIRGGNVIKLCNHLGFKLPDPKTLQQEFKEGYVQGLITDDFLKKFHRVHKESGVFPAVSLKDLRAHLEGSEYNPALKKANMIEKVNATWVNCNFLAAFNKLGKSKQQQVIDFTYQVIAAIGVTSSAHIVVGSDPGSKEPISLSKYFNVITGSVALKASSPAKKVNIKAEEMEFARKMMQAKKAEIGTDGLRVIKKLMQIADREDYNMNKLSSYSPKKIADIYFTALDLDRQNADIGMAYMDYEDDLTEDTMTRFRNY